MNIFTCNTIIPNIIDSCEDGFSFVNKFSDDSVPTVEALAAGLTIRSDSVVASFTSITMLSTDSRLALALTSPCIAGKGIMHTAWVTVTGLAFSDFGIAVVAFFTRFAVATAESIFASALASNLN